MTRRRSADSSASHRLPGPNLSREGDPPGGPDVDDVTNVQLESEVDAGTISGRTIPRGPRASQSDAHHAPRIRIHSADQTLAGRPDLDDSLPRSAIPAEAEPGPMPFKLQGEIGRGGVGVVFTAHDPMLHRDIAIKMLQRPDQRAAWDDFFAEAQITGQLEHPNIVPVHALDLDPWGAPYLAMKRIDGITLTEEILAVHSAERTGGREADIWAGIHELLDPFSRVCDAVRYAHARGVIHRDLKPSNVMIGAYGEVLVLDWGLAKPHDGSPDDTRSASDSGYRARSRRVGSGGSGSSSRNRAGRPSGSGRRSASSSRVDSDPSRPIPFVIDQDGSKADRTLAGTIIGTPIYMAPEQARGDTQAIGIRTDVYALGTILYTILVGLPPFSGPATEVLARVRIGEFTPPKRRRRQVPRELDAIVRRAMQTDPADRYPTVAALQDDVEAYRLGRSVSAARYSPFARLVKWARRNMPTVATGFVALIVLAITGAVLLGLLSDALDEEADRSAQLSDALSLSESQREELRIAEARQREATQAAEEGRRNAQAERDRAIAADRARQIANRRTQATLDDAIAQTAGDRANEFLPLSAIAMLSGLPGITAATHRLTIDDPFLQPMHDISGAEGPRDLAISHDGRFLAVRHGPTDPVRVYDTSSPYRAPLLYEISHDDEDGNPRLAEAITFSPNNQLVWIGGEGRLTAYSTSTGEMRGRYRYVARQQDHLIENADRLGIHEIVTTIDGRGMAGLGADNGMRLIRLLDSTSGVIPLGGIGTSVDTHPVYPWLAVVGVREDDGLGSLVFVDLRQGNATRHPLTEAPRLVRFVGERYLLIAVGNRVGAHRLYVKGEHGLPPGMAEPAGWSSDRHVLSAIVAGSLDLPAPAADIVVDNDREIAYVGSSIFMAKMTFRTGHSADFSEPANVPWDVATQAMPQGDIQALALDATSGHLMLIGEDAVIRRWVDRSESHGRPEDRMAGVAGMSFTGDGRYALWAGRDQLVVYDVAKRLVIDRHTIAGADEGARRIVGLHRLGASGNRFLLLQRDGRATSWRVGTTLRREAEGMLPFKPVRPAIASDAAGELVAIRAGESSDAGDAAIGRLTISPGRDTIAFSPVIGLQEGHAVAVDPAGRWIAWSDPNGLQFTFPDGISLGSAERRVLIDTVDLVAHPDGEHLLALRRDGTMFSLGIRRTDGARLAINVLSTIRVNTYEPVRLLVGPAGSMIVSVDRRAIIAGRWAVGDYPEDDTGGPFPAKPGISPMARTDYLVYLEQAALAPDGSRLILDQRTEVGDERQWMQGGRVPASIEVAERLTGLSRDGFALLRLGLPNEVGPNDIMRSGAPWRPVDHEAAAIWAELWAMYRAIRTPDYDSRRQAVVLRSKHLPDHPWSAALARIAEIPVEGLSYADRAARLRGAFHHLAENRPEWVEDFTTANGD